ncbi:MAG: response regulator [Planctomycetota bacterium]|jgi:CheY-like chemotaxis protein
MARILVIDDEPVVRGLFRTVLELDGHNVEEAADSPTGLAAYAREPADLVIVDLVMPHESGVIMIRKLREQYPNVRILPMTGLLTQLWSSDQLSKLLNADRTLAKPVTPDQIVEAVRDALAQKV